NVARLAFSPDSETLVMGVIGAPMPRQWENKVIVWDIGQQQPLAEIWDGWQYLNFVNRITFSKDGHVFVTNSDHTAVLWDINPVSWQARACQRAGRNLTDSERQQYFPGTAYRATCPDIPLDPSEVLQETNGYAVVGNSK